MEQKENPARHFVPFVVEQKDWLNHEKHEKHERGVKFLAVFFPQTGEWEMAETLFTDHKIHGAKRKSCPTFRAFRALRG